MTLKTSLENRQIIPKMADNLRHIGLETGDCVIVHSSFKSLCLTDHTPADVITTLIEVIGNKGTLIMPTFTYSYSGIWGSKAFHLDETPGVSNGILTETLRAFPGSLRSSHPTYSVVAIGMHSKDVTADKEHANALGMGSSFDEAKQLGAKILLLGVGQNRNSMIHHAEVAAGLPYNDIPFREFWGRIASVDHDGVITEVQLNQEFPGCSDNFEVVHEYLDQLGLIHQGSICAAHGILMSAEEMVNAVVSKLNHEPSWLLCDRMECEPCTLRKRCLLAEGLI